MAISCLPGQNEKKETNGQSAEIQLNRQAPTVPNTSSKLSKKKEGTLHRQWPGNEHTIFLPR